MKPLKLTLINFGPYAEQVFNFERLQQVPLFLITGKTGSGKTTIFDGITFALFGETAGGDRSAASLRSDFAEPQAETLVVLEFEHQGQHYRITRNPKQLLAKKRGSGMHEIAAAAKLESFDGEKKQAELTKVRDVNLKIEAILQLNRQQFVQIVLLPQGDFRRFLLSDSNEKEAILRKIFRTQLYQQWSETLREFLKSQQGKITQQQAAIKQAFKKIRWEDPAVVLDELNSTEQLKLLAQQQTRAQISLQDLAVAKKQAAVAVQNQQNELTAGKKLNQQFTELKQLQNKLQISHQQQPKYYKQAEQIKILEWAQKQQPLFVREQELQQRLQKVSLNLQTTKKQQQQQQQVLQEFQKQKELLLEQKEVQQQRETTKVLLTEQKSQFEKAAGLTKKVQHQDEQVKKIEIEQKLQQKKLSQLTEKLEKIAGLQTELPQLLQQRNLVDQTKLQLTHFKEQVVNLLQEQQALQALTTEVKQLQIKFEQAQLQSSNQQTAYQQLHDAWLNNQIAVLASQLSPGAPCPVCGSLNHPQPADQAMMKSINNTELKAAEKNKLAAEKNLNHLAAHLTEKKRTLTQQKEIFQQTKRELLKQLEQEKYLTKATLTLEKIQQVLTNQLQDQSQQLANLEEQVDVNQNSVAQRPQLLHQQQIEQQKVQQLGLDFQNEHDEQQRLTVRLAEIKRGLPKDFADIAELNSYLTGLEQKITTYQQQVTENQQQLERLQQQCASSAAVIKQQQAELTGLTSELQKVSAKIDDLMELQLATTERKTLAQLLEQTKSLPELRQQQADYYQQLAALKAQVASQENLLQKQQPVDLAKANDKFQQLQKQLDQIEDQYQKLYDQQLLNGSLLKEITTGRQEIQQQEAAISELAQLVTAVSGHSDAKLGLERYVLRQQLTTILRAANQHLQQLSSGRYWLQLHQERGNTLANTGLEIDVYDDHVGQLRSVHTLSGGESFIAALSLALALGEVIQEQAGGVSIDTLFVDEGFGSLDQDSLTTALAALEDIESGSRMIGIISHVEMLRAQIPAQIQISQLGQGQSRAKLVIQE